MKVYISHVTIPVFWEHLVLKPLPNPNLLILIIPCETSAVSSFKTWTILYYTAVINDCSEQSSAEHFSIENMIKNENVCVLLYSEAPWCVLLLH